MSKGNAKKIVDFTEAELRDIFIKAGLRDEEVDKAVADYTRYRESELSSLSVLSFSDLQSMGAEGLSNIIMNLRNGGEIIDRLLRYYSWYLKEKKAIAEAYQKSKSWDKVITTVVYSDSNSSQEAFIDYVEETYKTKVKDAKHLQKLTGITKETLEGLEETVIIARYSKYFRALERSLNDGAKYKDLLKIKPEDYGLNKTWDYCLGSDQYSSILYAIAETFLVDESGGLMILPSLRSIAEEIEAPYSVLMDCYNITNRQKKYGATGN